MKPVTGMLECRRTVRHLQRFLDRDPSAPLSAEERQRVQAHLDQCAKCAALSEEYRALHRSLQQLGATMEPDAVAVDRVRRAVDRTLEAEGS